MRLYLLAAGDGSVIHVSNVERQLQSVWSRLVRWKHHDYKAHHSEKTYSGFIARTTLHDKLWCFAFEVDHCTADFTVDWRNSSCTRWNIRRWQFSTCSVWYKTPTATCITHKNNNCTRHHYNWTMRLLIITTFQLNMYLSLQSTVYSHH